MAAATTTTTTTTRTPEDTVFYTIHPDTPQNPNSLQSLHLQILQIISPYTTNYIWQHQPFTLSLSTTPNNPQTTPPHLHGKTRYGDNLEDEWFIVFLLFKISHTIPSISIRVWDSDGEFLLIEAAFSLPKWITPENSDNRVFIRHGDIHIVPNNRFQVTPTLVDALRFLVCAPDEARASNEVQLAVKNRISGFPERARVNMHRVRVRVPVSVAEVLRNEPCLISLAVEGFYDRDIDSMKYAGKMERFLSGGKGEELVRVGVTMSRAMYAQLKQQMFQAPKCYPVIPDRMDSEAYLEAELGMKIACGFEMIYQQRRVENSEGRVSSVDVFRQSLERSDYFDGLLPGSKEYNRKMESAMENHRKSLTFSKAREMINVPARRIDEILASPYSADNFRSVEVPPSDSDAWLYDGEDELNSALLERQKEMEMYELNHKRSKKSKEQESTSGASSMSDFDPADISKTMQAFVQKVSSYEGAEVPENRDSKAVTLDVDNFFKDLESVMRQVGKEGSADGAEMDEGSSSDLDFDDSEDGSEGTDDIFMESYTDALKEQLKSTTLEKSFVRANEQPPKKENEGASSDRMDEDFTPVDVDVNLVKSLLDSFSSQQGLPGPASNLLGLMGLRIPQDSNKDK